jgi:hypothetical protein
MPVERSFRGRPIKRTRRVGSRVLITFRGPSKGAPGPRLVVGLPEYLAGLQTLYLPRPGGESAPPS